MRFHTFSRPIGLLGLLGGVILLSASAAAAQNEFFTIEPRKPSTLERVRVTAGLWSSHLPDLRFEGVHGNRIEFSADHFDLQLPHQAPHAAAAELDPLPAGIYQVVLQYRGLPLAVTHTFEVLAPEPLLVLHEKRSDVRSFGVIVDWKLPSGQTGQGIAVPLTNESGYFWFFDAGNAEVTIKILDGRQVNGHWWVFLASMTDVEHTVKVTLCPPDAVGAPCFQKEYRNPRGTNRNILDTQAF
jgi:hypothetical protein